MQSNSCLLLKRLANHKARAACDDMIQNDVLLRNRFENFARHLSADAIVQFIKYFIKYNIFTQIYMTGIYKVGRFVEFATQSTFARNEWMDVVYFPLSSSIS